jgi:hypothetical protein
LACIFLTLVDHIGVTCLLEQIGLRVGAALPGHQHEIVGQDAIHGGYVVGSDRSLVFVIERAHDLAVVVGRGHSGKSEHEKGTGRNTR